jgi:pSer/pThr/pTyr-binding forkhead associated (FHA) protein
VNVPDEAPAGDSTQIKSSPYSRSNGGGASSGEEDWAAPQSEEYVTGDSAGVYGEDEVPAPRGDETRVGVVPDAPEEEEEAPRDEDDNPDATRAGPPVTLDIIEGPDKGKKKRFRGVRMVVGRAKDIDVELSDQSVSRRHFELVMGEGGVLLRDLGGANGTKVNDERVDERLLQHGDVIAVGKTRIRLVDEQKQIEQLRAEAEAREAEEKRKKEEAAAAAKKAAAERSAARGSDVDPNDPRLNEATVARYQVPEGLQDGGGARPRPERRPSPVAGIPKVKLIGFGLIGLVTVLLVGLILAVGRTTPEAPPPDPMEAKKEAKAAALMQQAWNALRADDYAEAVKLAEQADKIIPGSDKDGLAKGARVELTIAEGLKEARALLDAGNFDEARAKLSALPQGTVKSSDAKKKLMGELEESEKKVLSQKVLDLVAARDVQGARDTIAKLPIVLQGPYLRQVAELEQELAREAQEEEKRARTDKVYSAKRAKERRKELIAEAFGNVERKFHGGDYQRAVLECDRVVDAAKGDKEIRERARTLKKLIPQFQRNFEDGQRKFKANSLEAAAKPLRAAASLYQQIGFGGSLGESINEMLAASSLAAGKAALARNDISAAGSHFREALRLNPGDSRAQAGLDSLAGKLEELYLQAYILRDRDPQAAIEKFKVVIDAAPEGSEVKRKAELHLSEMQP